MTMFGDIAAGAFGSVVIQALAHSAAPRDLEHLRPIAASPSPMRRHEPTPSESA